VGGPLDGQHVGTVGRVGCFSFNGNKLITTGGGGMLVTDDRALAQHVRKLSTQAREAVTHYEHTEVGYNYRLSNLLAALGRAQLSRLDEMMQRRRRWRLRYEQLVAELSGIRILGGENDTEDNCWLTALIMDQTADTEVGELHQAFTGAGVETRPLWKPMHRQPVYADCGGTLDGTADALFRDGLTLPSGSGMTSEQLALVTDVLAMVAS
jgi:dTDP-4-amino-4,6-dideoxygalactose transaminase